MRSKKESEKIKVREEERPLSSVTIASLHSLALCFQPRSRPFVWLFARTWIRKNTDCFAFYFSNYCIILQAQSPWRFFRFLVCFSRTLHVHSILRHRLHLAFLSLQSRWHWNPIQFGTYVVLSFKFILGLNFLFFCFWSYMEMYDNDLKQNKTKLNHNINTSQEVSV